VLALRADVTEVTVMAVERQWHLDAHLLQGPLAVGAIGHMAAQLLRTLRF
jgi:hypothetical protein